LGAEAVLVLPVVDGGLGEAADGIVGVGGGGGVATLGDGVAGDYPLLRAEADGFGQGGGVGEGEDGAGGALIWRLSIFYSNNSIS
jgi:hypothetical protein